MEKEPQPDSMATITMKAEYPPSEVYSASEPPPAYRHRVPASVQIARIAALTVVASAFILGSFILASSWVTARASCRQLEQLDAMLDKELALEGRAYGNDALLPDEPLPVHNAHALRAAPPSPSEEPPSPAPSASPAAPASASQHKDDVLNQAETKIDENKLQSIDNKVNKNELPISDEDNSDSDSSMEEEEDLDVFKPLLKLPIHFDLDELASTFLSSNQKGRMNCMMERRSEDPMERRFPFNILGAFAPRAAASERIAIICRGGDDSRVLGGFPEPQAQVFAFPLTGPMRLPLRPQPPAPPAPAPRAPLMPEHRAGPFMPLPQHRPAPFPLSMPWESSEEQAPRVRIHVQRVIAVPAAPSPASPPAPPAPPAPSAHHVPPAPDAVSHFAPPPPPMQSHHEQPTILHQFVPQPAPTQELEQPEMESPVQISLPWGLTPDDLQAIRHSAEDVRRDHQLDNDMQEVKTIVNSIAAAAEAEAVAQAQADEQRRQVQDHQRMVEAQRQAEEQRQAEAHRQAEEQRQVEEQRQTDRQADELRTEESVEQVPEGIAQPPRAPRTIMLPQDLSMDQRPHFMQPRSVGSAEGALSRKKRATRCECY